MAGVIDADGTQWEHCNRCGRMVKIETLWYEKPSTRFEFGRDLCGKCAALQRYTDNVTPPSQLTLHVVHLR